MDAAADVLAGLRDIRLPAQAEGSLLADATAAFSIGLLAALVLALLARTITRRRQSRRETALADLEATRRLEGEERLLAQAKLLQRVAMELGSGAAEEASHWSVRLDRRLGTDFFATGAGAELRKALYRRRSHIDSERLDQELERLLRSIGG